MTCEAPRESDTPQAHLQRLEVLEAVLDESTDPIFSILEDGTYRYVNRAFAAPFGRQPEEVIGRHIGDIFSPEEAEKRMAVVRRALASGETLVFDVRVPTPEGDTFYITSVKPVSAGKGPLRSVICISKNITDRKRAEQERERLVDELQAALLQVRTLSGMLPICACCKKIRDDQGYWTQLEAYIQSRTEAEFTHGICPDCARTLYPEYRRPKQEGKA